MHEGDDFKIKHTVFAACSEELKSLCSKKEKKIEFPEIYKKAFVSKQTYHDMFIGIIPSKDTMIKFALALECTIEEAEKLLKCAGHAFSDCIRRDIILKKCFEDSITDILEVNEILKEKGEVLLVKDFRNIKEH